jgi:hypothetical protein
MPLVAEALSEVPNICCLLLMHQLKGWPAMKLSSLAVYLVTTSTWLSY